MWGVIKVLAVLFGPRLFFFLSSLPGIMAAVKKFITIRTKRSLLEVCLELAIFVHVLFLAYQHASPSYGRNFFSETNIINDAPAYIIRNQFRTYIDQVQAQHQDVSFADDKYECVGNPALAQKLNILDRLSQDLRLKENRSVYVRYGHEAYFNCEICHMKRPLDYTWFVAPRGLIQYCTFLLLVTILSYTIIEKTRWKYLAVVVVFFAASVETSLLFSQELLGMDLLPYILGSSSHSTYWERLQFCRISLIAIFSIALVLFDLPPFISETDLLLRAARQSIATCAFKLHLGRIVGRTMDNGRGIAPANSTLTPDDLALLSQPGTLTKLDEYLNSH